MKEEKCLSRQSKELMSHIPPRTLVSPQHRSRARAAASCTSREETQPRAATEGKAQVSGGVRTST